MIPHSKPMLGEEEISAVERVLRSGHLAQGAEVEAFEAECAAMCGRRYGVAVSSGTAALHLALVALEVGAGDLVAIASYACAALTTAIRLQGAVPVLCDINDDYNLEPASMSDHCGVAIVAHLFGAPAPIPGDCVIIEDIAQSMGGITGRNSPMAVTSFYATKLMTTGEGGMLLTDDAALAELVRDRRDYDNRATDARRFAYKMTDFQAAMGRVQLRRLPEFLQRRLAIAEQYTQALSDCPVRLPATPGHVFFRYVLATNRREALEAHLRQRGIEAKRPVYCPAHHYLKDSSSDAVRALPNAERAHEECLSLPIYPALVDEQVSYVIESVRHFFV